MMQMLSNQMNQKTNNEAINGILLLNKPQGITSNLALQKVKRLFKAKKAGHTGSLDPFATGMLPICLGEATKFSHYLLNDDKTYLATGLLGIKTDTGDLLGKIIDQVDHFYITEEQLQTVISQFIGQTLQIPSMFSALKFKGQPLYKLARQGITIEREPRPIFIHSIKLLFFDGCRFKLEIHCGKGTYIRNLIEDIGQQLGVYAHTIELHRLYINQFKEKPIYGLDDLNTMSELALQSCLLSCEAGLMHLPMLHLNDQETLRLRQGQVLLKENMQANGHIRLYTVANQFIGLGEMDSFQALKVKRLLA